MERAQSAGCRPETAGGGERNLANRPSLLPCGMERARVRPAVPPPNVAGHARMRPHMPRARPNLPRARDSIGRAHDPAGVRDSICRAHDPAGVRDSICRAHDPAGVRDSICRAHDPAGVRDSICRAHDPAGGRDSICRAHDPAGVRDFVPLIPLSPPNPGESHIKLVNISSRGGARCRTNAARGGGPPTMDGRALRSPVARATLYPARWTSICRARDLAGAGDS